MKVVYLNQIVEMLQVVCLIVEIEDLFYFILIFYLAYC